MEVKYYCFINSQMSLTIKEGSFCENLYLAFDCNMPAVVKETSPIACTGLSRSYCFINSGMSLSRNESSFCESFGLAFDGNMPSAAEETSLITSTRLSRSLIASAMS